MARPIPVRLQQLQQQEAGLIKERIDMALEVNDARGRAQHAVLFYELCKQSLADMDTEIAASQAQVSQAALEKADHEAAKLGERAGAILEDLKVLAEKCSEGGLAYHLRQAITMAATAQAVTGQPVNGGAACGAAATPQGKPNASLLAAQTSRKRLVSHQKTAR